MRNVPSWYQQSSPMCLIVAFQTLSFTFHIELLASIIRLLISTQSSRGSHRQHGLNCTVKPRGTPSWSHRGVWCTPTYPSSSPCQNRRYWPTRQEKFLVLSLDTHTVYGQTHYRKNTYISFSALHDDLGIQYLRSYFKNGMPFEVFIVIKESPAFTEVVCPCFLCCGQLMHIPECQWKQRNSGHDQSYPPLEAVLLAGRFQLHTLLRNNQANHPHLQNKINDTQNKRPTMYDQEPGCITCSNFCTSVQVSHEMTLAYITLILIIRKFQIAAIMIFSLLHF